MRFAAVFLTQSWFQRAVQAPLNILLGWHRMTYTHVRIKPSKEMLGTAMRQLTLPSPSHGNATEMVAKVVPKWSKVFTDLDGNQTTLEPHVSAQHHP
jgi:hypothetical protein